MSRLVNVKCESKVNPINVDTKTPGFSWQIKSDERNIFQESYRIIVKKGNVIIWDSGEKKSSSTFGRSLVKVNSTL